jgi:hypothetical protein
VSVLTQTDGIFSGGDPTNPRRAMQWRRRAPQWSSCDSRFALPTTIRRACARVTATLNLRHFERQRSHRALSSVHFQGQTMVGYMYSLIFGTKVARNIMPSHNCLDFFVHVVSGAISLVMRYIQILTSEVHLSYQGILDRNRTQSPVSDKQLTFNIKTNYDREQRHSEV